MKHSAALHNSLCFFDFVELGRIGQESMGFFFLLILHLPLLNPCLSILERRVWYPIRPDEPALVLSDTSFMPIV